MHVGTKSLLFGVHAMWWHPFVVLLGWIRLYKKFPSIPELVGIICHDLGYWGCTDMDGECGLTHPIRGAHVADRIVRGLNFLMRPLGLVKHESLDIWSMCLFHSGSFSREMGAKPSRLCGPDKVSILYDPWWFYSLRARLTGELGEYVKNGPPGLTPRQWFDWLRDRHRHCYAICSTYKKDQDPELDV